MKRKFFSFLKKVMVNYGEIAMMQYCPPTGIIPLRKSWAYGSTLSLNRNKTLRVLHRWWDAPDCKSGSFEMNRFESFYPHILSSGRCGICTRLKIWLTWFNSTLLSTMYCKIMKVDCPHAGQIQLNGYMEMGEENGN